MFIPKAFERREPGDLYALIEQRPLGTLVTEIDGRLEAAHVPILADRDIGENGQLRFHLAGMNPMCTALDGKRELLCVFVGPETYISPDWYRTEHMVPTWNYASVHAYGKPARLDDEALCELLDDLSAVGEGRLPKTPWTTAKMPADTYAKMRGAIVGYRMPIERLEGKWKMSQNRSAGDREAVAAELKRLGGESPLAVAAIMAEETAG